MAGLNWINWPIEIEIKLNPNGVEIDGVQMPYMIVAETINQILHPDPRKWYRLVRTGDIITVNVRLSEDEPNGTPVGNTGPSAEDPGRERQETPHP